MRATIACLLVLTVLGCDTSTKKEKRDKSADESEDESERERPKPAKRAASSAGTSATPASGRPERDVSKLAAFTLGTKYSSANFFDVMEQVTKDKKHGVERNRLLSEARLNSDYLGLAAPTAAGDEYISRVQAMAKSLRDKHGKTTEMIFLTGLRLYDARAPLARKTDASQYFADLDRSFPQTEISPAVWRPLYEKLKTNFETGDVDKLSKAIIDELKK